jgi:hypothetical protein
LQEDEPLPVVAVPFYRWIRPLTVWLGPASLVERLGGRRRVSKDERRAREFGEGCERAPNAIRN